MRVFVLEGTERKDVMEPLVNQYSTLINLCEVLVQRVASSVSDRQPSNSLLMALEARRVRNPSSHAIVGQFRGLGRDGSQRRQPKICQPMLARECNQALIDDASRHLGRLEATLPARQMDLERLAPVD